MVDPVDILQRRYDFGEAVARRRKAVGLTQDRLAEIVGCDRKSINRLENGSNAVTLDRLWPVADALNISIGWLEEEAREIAKQRQQRSAQRRRGRPEQPE